MAGAEEAAQAPTLTWQEAPLPDWARGTRQAYAELGNWRRRTASHAWQLTAQLPRFLLLLVWYSPVGLVRLGGLARRFLWDQQSAEAAAKALLADDQKAWQQANAQRSQRLRARWWASVVTAVAVSAVPLAYLAPWVLAGLVGVGVVTALVKVIPGRTVWEYVAGALAGGAATWGAHEALVLWLPPMPLWPLMVAAALAVLALGWVGRPDDRKLTPTVTPLAADKQAVTAPYVIDALCRIGVKGLEPPKPTSVAHAGRKAR